MTCHGEFVTGDWIVEEVVDDAVVRRVETSDDGVMIRESESWENGNETCDGFSAVGDETVDVGSWGFELVTETETVGGNEDDDGMREFFEGTGGGCW
jgi:hypothetical protein